MAPGPRGQTGGFPSVLCQQVLPSERSLPGFQSSPKPLAFCLSACLSHVAAALREGEDFGLGIVGRESVLAGLCVKEHRCETLGRTLSAQHGLQGAEGKEFSKRKGDTKNETLGGRQLPRRLWAREQARGRAGQRGDTGLRGRKGRDGSGSGVSPFTALLPPG